MSIIPRLSRDPQASTWLTTLTVALVALLPGCAQAFPFIAAGGGAVILPYVLAMMAGMMRSKIAIAATTVSILGGYWLVYAPYDYVTDTYSFEENRLAGMLGERVHSIRNVRMTAPDTTKEVGYPELFTTASKVLFVNDGGLAWRNGYEAEYILSNQRFLSKDAVLVSAGTELAETIANATGTRWLKGGLVGVLEGFAQRTDFPPLDTAECEPNSKCARIGVMGAGFFMRFSGFPYNSKDRMIDLHELMMPHGGGIDVLKKYQADGKHLSLELYDYPGHDLDRGMFNFLQSEGIKNLSVHYYDEQAKTRGNIDVLASRFGGSNKHLNLDDIDFLCENDTSFVMAFDGRMNTGMLFPETLRDNCEAVFLPVEGMLPHQIASYLKEHPLPKGRRFVGIYTDKSTAFYTKLMLGLMTDQGYPVVGITSLDKEHVYVGDPIKRVIDSGLMALSEHIQGEDGKPSTSWVVVIFSALFSALTLSFLLASRRLTVMLAWAANLGAMLLLNFFARYIPNDMTADIFEVCLFIAISQMLLAMLRVPKFRTFTKMSGLSWLKKSGFSTPSSRYIRKFDQRVFNQLMGKAGVALIFRSCASGENLGAADSGRFTSFVSRDPYGFDGVEKAWQEMINAGRRPGFVVQPFMRFEATGAVSSVRDSEGRIAYVIETSKIAEGVTSGLDSQVRQQYMTRESLTASDMPLHQQIIAMHKRLQGHFLAEFGILEGKVTWLQVMRQRTLLSDHRSFKEAGYEPSPLNGLIDVTTPNALEFMNKAVCGISYLSHQGRVFEKTNRIGAWINSMAFVVPWRTLSWLMDFAWARIAKSPSPATKSRTLLFWSRLALIIDQVTVAKGQSDRGVVDTMTARYASTFGSSEMFLQAPDQMAALLRNYQIFEGKKTKPGRVNLELRIRDRAREVVQVVYAIECLRDPTFKASSCQPLVAEPSFELASNLVCPGGRPAGSVVIDLRSDSANGLAQLQVAENATVILEHVDLSVLVDPVRIACIKLQSRPPYNSHFVQRCLAYGIRIEVTS